MSLSKDTLFRLEHALTDTALAKEVAKRLISDAPATEQAAKDLLATFDLKKDKDIYERFFTALAGNGSQGLEIAHKLVKMAEVIEALTEATGAVPGVKAKFEGFVNIQGGGVERFEIEADAEGLAGNVTLTGNAVDSVAELITASGKALTILDGDPNSIPSNQEDIELTGGLDPVPGQVDPSKAITEMGTEPLSDETKFYLLHALTDKKAAEEFAEAFDKMVSVLKNL